MRPTMPSSSRSSASWARWKGRLAGTSSTTLAPSTAMGRQARNRAWRRGPASLRTLSTRRRPDVLDRGQVETDGGRRRHRRRGGRGLLRPRLCSGGSRGLGGLLGAAAGRLGICRRGGGDRDHRGRRTARFGLGCRRAHRATRLARRHRWRRGGRLPQAAHAVFEAVEARRQRRRVDRHLGPGQAQQGQLHHQSLLAAVAQRRQGLPQDLDRPQHVAAVQRPGLGPPLLEDLGGLVDDLLELGGVASQEDPPEELDGVADEAAQVGPFAMPARRPGPGPPGRRGRRWPGRAG